MDRVRQLPCCRHGRIAGGFPGRHVPRTVYPGQKETPMNKASIVPAGLPALDAATDQHRLAVETHLLQQIHATGPGFMQIGRAESRESMCQYVEISGVTGTL